MSQQQQQEQKQQKQLVLTLWQRSRRSSRHPSPLSAIGTCWTRSAIIHRDDDEEERAQEHTHSKTNDSKARYEQAKSKMLAERICCNKPKQLNTDLVLVDAANGLSQQRRNRQLPNLINRTSFKKE